MGAHLVSIIEQNQTEQSGMGLQGNYFSPREQDG